MGSKYIIDSNVFIQGKNFHYDFAFCEGFWDWVAAGYASKVIYSIGKVKAELVMGKKGDAAKNWAEKMPKDFFLDDVSDPIVMSAYSEIMNWADSDKFYQNAALKRFSEVGRADAFLLAYAKAHGHIVVTQEVSNPDKRKEVPIPDAAIKIGGIKTITIFDLLKTHAKPTFVFQP